jgi:hypothetical protein
MLVMAVTELTCWWRSLPASAGDTAVLALEGPSGAGKTTLANVLAAAAPSSVVVHLDAIYPGWDGLADTPDLLVDQLLRPMSSGRPAGYRRWDWAAGRDGAWQPVEPAPPLLLLEGIGCGARVCAPYLAGLVWLDAPEPLRRERALTRDGPSYAPYWQRWADQESAYLSAQQPWRRADLILDGAATAPAAAMHLLTDRRRGG